MNGIVPHNTHLRLTLGENALIHFLRKNFEPIRRQTSQSRAILTFQVLCYSRKGTEQDGNKDVNSITTNGKEWVGLKCKSKFRTKEGKMCISLLPKNKKTNSGTTFSSSSSSNQFRPPLFLTQRKKMKSVRPSNKNHAPCNSYEKWFIVQSIAVYKYKGTIEKRENFHNRFCSEYEEKPEEEAKK